MNAVTVTVIGNEGCHLCDDAKAVIDAVISELSEVKGAPSVTVVERSLSAEPDLREEFGDKIPVVFVNDVFLSHWHVDGDALRGRLLSFSE